MQSTEAITIFWFRRDLRIHDNVGLYNALHENDNVLPVFIFDKNILMSLPEHDSRVAFIYNHLTELKQEIEKHVSSLLTIFDTPENAFLNLIEEHNIKDVYTNHDYEPYAINRDLKIKNLLASKGIPFKTFKDQVIFEKEEVTKADGKPYTIFTPYMKKWKTNYEHSQINEYTNNTLFANFYKTPPFKPVTLNDLGFNESTIELPTKSIALRIIESYDKTRDFPAINGTTRLGAHLRHGTISIRKLVNTAQKHNEIFLNELIWREFYMMILWHFPNVKKEPFKPQYNNLELINNLEDFEKWQYGQTGYPLVDAGMKQLNKTGYMHNRLRMVTASFLTKHLLIDWRWGEAWFASKLLDYELASNNGGWQWAASSGCDAVPYFRIFNPTLQLKRFDKKHDFIKKWLPEYQSPDYPKPIVEHSFARQRAIGAYKKAFSDLSQ